MTISFKILPYSRNLTANTTPYTAYLIYDNWDDYSFSTLFHLYFVDENKKQHTIGLVKIGYFNQQDKSIDKNQTYEKLEKNFTEIDNNFFSLGQSPEYYENIYKLNLTDILINLNDIVINENTQKKALKEEVTQLSLLRGINLISIEQFKRILNGGAKLNEYEFKYILKKTKQSQNEILLTFLVNPNHHLPTNIHALIGANGVGKTYILHNMLKSMLYDETTIGEFQITNDIFSNTYISEKNKDIFSNIIYISFSAFDDFDIIDTIDKKDNFQYIGLKNPQTKELKNINELSEDFINSLKNCIKMKEPLWKSVTENLFSNSILRNFISDNNINNINQGGIPKINVNTSFKKLSSGHKIVMLIIAQLIEKTQEKTLILMDEPETHLHPPLLSNFMSALSELLSYRNAVAILATHSPVILQEIPSFCAWKLYKEDTNIKAERPKINTFGENINTLTQEVFGLEMDAYGYIKTIKKHVANDNLKEIYSNLNDQIGTEAKAILQILQNTKND